MAVDAKCADLYRISSRVSFGLHAGAPPKQTFYSDLI